MMDPFVSAPASSFRSRAVRRLVLVATLTAIGLGASTRDAAAARIPVIYQTGQDAFVCGPLPAPFDKTADLTGFQAAYLCDITGVFWSYFSVRNCKPVALKGDSYNDAPELVAAIKAAYPESSIKRGVWNHYGWLIIAAAIALGIGMWIRSKVKGDD